MGHMSSGFLSKLDNIYITQAIKKNYIKNFNNLEIDFWLIILLRKLLDASNTVLSPSLEQKIMKINGPTQRLPS